MNRTLLLNSWSVHQHDMLENVTTLVNSNASECLADERTLGVALAVVYTIICIVGLLGNALALYVFLFIHRKRNTVQVYLLNVAIADLLLIFCLPFRITYHLSQNNWKMGLIFCKIIGNLFYMNMYISIVLLGLISMDRYVKVKKSQRLNKVSKRIWSIRICCLLWVLAVIAIIFLIATQSGKDQNNANMCFHYKDRKDEIWQAGFNYFVVMVFWMVFLSLILSYVRIGKNLIKISRERAHLPNSEKYNSTAQKSFFVLFIFTVCFVPYHTFRIIYITSQLQQVSCYWIQIIHRTNEMMLALSALNSCLDPVMYFLLSSSIRKAVFQLICRVSRDTGRSESNTSELHQGTFLQESGSAHAFHSHGTSVTKMHYKRSNKN
ncbi:probable G-protein coupled receptor 34 [Bombina bombina]|uniref:probable G-protein coupled receptor 34 n=1 Tax=Bombina bombina TaxID=8345 RepID=UPI00235A82C2|nr:probable G-protein coupled receptor 34 [Bombina bombina]